jgi:hypothetical protein
MSVEFSTQGTDRLQQSADAASGNPPPLNLLKADSHIACRAHAVSLPCRAAKGLECVFPI